ncbi:MAG: hypothetical protein MI741_09050, partial [Rhodospirillales bacterium]|nr:hypothetical protein [Rhodospirillales bacterium]
MPEWDRRFFDQGGHPFKAANGCFGETEKETQMLKKSLALALAMAIAGGVSNGLAADLPSVHFKMAGQDSTQNMGKHLLEPYFKKEITEKSGGAITVAYTSSNELGMKGTETVRLTGLGVFDLATG